VRLETNTNISQAIATTLVPLAIRPQLGAITLIQALPGADSTEVTGPLTESILTAICGTRAPLVATTVRTGLSATARVLIEFAINFTFGQ